MSFNNLWCNIQLKMDIVEQKKKKGNPNDQGAGVTPK